MRNFGTISTQDLVPEISPGKVNPPQRHSFLFQYHWERQSVKALYLPRGWVLTALTASEKVETPQGREVRSLRRGLVGLVLLNITFI